MSSQQNDPSSLPASAPDDITDVVIVHVMRVKPAAKCRALAHHHRLTPLFVPRQMHWPDHHYLTVFAHNYWPATAESG